MVDSAFDAPRVHTAIDIATSRVKPVEVIEAGAQLSPRWPGIVAAEQQCVLDDREGDFRLVRQ